MQLGFPPPSVPRLSGSPLIGHTHNMRKDRTAVLLRASREEPELAALRVGFVRPIVISSPALAYEILQTKHEHFTKAPGLTVFLRPVLGNGLLTSEGSFHARQRKLLAPAFMHKRISSYAATMADRADRMIDAIRDGDLVDASDRMMRLTLEIVGKTLFDAEVGSDADAVGAAVDTVMKTTIGHLSSLVPIPPFVPTPANLRNRRAVEQLDAIIYRLIRERRQEGADRGDLLSMLLASRDEDGAAMSDKQVRDEAMNLFLAGHETTANALSWALYLLAKHPAERAKLEAEVDALGVTPSYDDLPRLPYARAALKEAMRLYPPAYVVVRRVETPVTIGTHRLGRNTIVVVNILGIHRRADLYDAPDAFRPERFLGDLEKQLPRCGYMPFGAGPRICIGNQFALMEGHVLLAAMLRRARFDLVSDKPVETEPLVTLRPRGGVPMHVTLRNPDVR